MSKPYLHAEACVRRWGGQRSDYEHVHIFMDSSKIACADNRHRVFTHQSWFIEVVLPAVYGETLINSAGREVSIRAIGEWHCIEDFGFIPAPSDYIEALDMREWMNNGKGEPPTGASKIMKRRSVQQNGVIAEQEIDVSALNRLLEELTA